MLEINTQFLKQWRLAIVPLRPKRSQPTRPQAALFTHPSTNARSRGSKAAITSSGGVGLR
jgi:hypothetical protein